ncbi:hypothetical protein SSRP02_p033 [Synechococcus phage S-SRP02]|nr:hypothetical protein SSRP02_p033 [Synechococcus phage S-SRP02]
MTGKEWMGASQGSRTTGLTADPRQRTASSSSKKFDQDTLINLAPCLA